MKEERNRRIEREAAEALLSTGVSVPWARFRLPFTNRKIVLRATMRRPTLASQIAIAKEYLEMNTSLGEIQAMEYDQQMSFIALYGREVSRIIALAFIRGSLQRRLLTRPLAWLVREVMPLEYMAGVILHFVSLLSTDPFLPIINLAASVNPMKPRIAKKSQTEKGS